MTALPGQISLVHERSPAARRCGTDGVQLLA